MTSDSIRARPMIMAVRMAPPAEGLRAMPSQAAAMPRPWPIAPAAAAMPSRNAAETRFQRTPVGAGATGCANADAATSSTAIVRKIIFLFTRISFLLSLMFFRGDGAYNAEVHHRQHDEDECLEHRSEDAQGHHRPGNDHRHQAHEDPGGGVLAEDIAEETHAQREGPGEVADHLDREHQRRQPPHRPHEVLEVMPHSLRPDSLIVEVEERGDRQRERRVRIARRRLQEVEEAEDVGDEDEHREGCDHPDEALAPVADDVVHHVPQADDEELEGLLQRAGVVAGVLLAWWSLN